jgi:hypothetical protein
MTTLATVLSGLQTACGAVTGIKDAPAYPPEQANDWPFLVTYFTSFRGEVNTPEDFRLLYDVVIELHINRRELPYDVAAVLGYAETVPNAFFKWLRDNGIAHESVDGYFGVMGWGDDPNWIATLGFRWTIKDVKIVTAIT